MKIQPIDMADFDLVEMTNDKPSCRRHGAMNKITRNEDGGGIWRCITVHAYLNVKNGNATGKKEIDCVCRAGCMQIS